MGDSGATRNDMEVELSALAAGFPWACGQMNALHDFFANSSVQAAMNLLPLQQGKFRYDTSGPASITLWPDLVKQLRVLIYNGDADSCVPYKGNEEWTEGMATSGDIVETKPWHPWYADKVPQVPAGYATSY